jgi:hypothetical protein
MTRMEVVRADKMAWKAWKMWWRRKRLVDAFATSKKWFALLARRKELGWGEQGSGIGNLTADVAAEK